MNKPKYPIPIKNLFFMLCYAWNVLSIKDSVKLQEEDFDDAYNLLARLLIYGVRKLIKRGFHKAYVEDENELACLKGKIDINGTINLRIKNIRKCNCQYDEFSKNNNFNKIIHYTLCSLLKNSFVEEKQKKEIRSILIYFGDIDEIAPCKTELRKLKFNNNNKNYKMIINVCSMIYNGTLVNENDGNNSFKDFFREEQMQKVFELFVLNFYGIHLDKNIYRVHAPKINWHLESNAADYWGMDFDIESNPCDRRTDIVIENKTKKIQIIIDAKYYSEAMVSGYRNDDVKMFRSAHINQVRGYVLDSEFDGDKLGALMYPTVNIDLDKGKLIPIKGSPIIMKTLNLNQDWRLIEKDLLEFASKVLDK